MPTIRSTEKVLFLGGYQQGKTSAAKELMRQRVARGGRFAWYDTPWEGSDIDGAAVVTSSLEEMRKALLERKNVVYQPRGGGSREDMDAFFGVCKGFANLIQVLDEAHCFVGHSTPAEQIPNLNHAIRLGHKWGRGLWMISHRVSDFPGSARNVHHVFHFKTFVALDVEAARDILGDAYAELLRSPTLPKYHFVYWGPESGSQICKPLPIGKGKGNLPNSNSSTEKAPAPENVETQEKPEISREEAA